MKPFSLKIFMQPNLFNEEFNRTKKQPNTSIKLEIVRSFSSIHTDRKKSKQMHGQVSSKKEFELAPRKIKQVSAYANEANWESELSLQKDSNSADRPWEIEKSTNEKVLARGLGHSPKIQIYSINGNRCFKSTVCKSVLATWDNCTILLALP